MSALIRLPKEISKCFALENVELECDNVYDIHVTISPNTNVFTKKYKFKIVSTPDYPFVAPKVVFLTSVFHPNIDGSGRICLPILTQWSQKYTISNIILDVLDLFKNPNLSDPINLNAEKLWGTEEYKDYL